MTRALLLAFLTLPACALPTGPTDAQEAPAEVALPFTPCDCDGLPTTPCSRPACDDGTCYLEHTDDGEPADVDQPHGDCLTAVCVGLAVVQAYEPHDRPTLPDICGASLCTPAGPVWIARDGCPF